MLKEGIDPLDNQFHSEVVNADAQVAGVERPEACLDVATDPKNIEQLAMTVSEEAFYVFEGSWECVRDRVIVSLSRKVQCRISNKEESLHEQH